MNFKTFYLFLLQILFVFSAYADNTSQFIRFEDANFERYMIEHFDADKDSLLSSEEAMQVEVISCQELGIVSLQGIEYCENLTELNFGRNNVTSLDLSKNTKLTVLDLDNNKVAELDLSNNQLLKSLDCESNMLKTLDITPCPLLTEINCMNNPIEELHVLSSQSFSEYSVPSDAHIIFHLSFMDTIFEKYMLEHFDTDKDGNLSSEETMSIEIISCTDLGITSLQGIEYCENLTELYFGRNNVTSLDLSKNTRLSILDFDHNEIAELDLSNNQLLKSLDCENNLLKRLDITPCPLLTEINCLNNPLEELHVRDLQQFSEFSIPSSTLIEYQLSFEDANFEQYMLEHFDADNDGWLSSKEAMQVEVISCQELGIVSLQGIEYCENLTELNFGRNNVTSLDLSKNTKLSILDFDHNDVSKLDLSNNRLLKELDCGFNQISSLDLSSSTFLEEIDCGDNLLTKIDLPSNNKITSLKCNNNYLEFLDISYLVSLSYFNCGNNSISQLDLSSNTLLTELNCEHNELATLNVNELNSLTNLNCRNNKITNLDINNNQEIYSLVCSGNQLSKLNIINNQKLYSLDCSKNQLNSLNVSNNPNLKELDCSDNPNLELYILSTQDPKYEDTDKQFTLFEISGIKEVVHMDLDPPSSIEKIIYQSPDLIPSISLDGKLVEKPNGIYIQEGKIILIK